VSFSLGVQPRGPICLKGSIELALTLGGTHLGVRGRWMFFRRLK